jgi:hypothetical protein
MNFCNIKSHYSLEDKSFLPSCNNQLLMEGSCTQDIIIEIRMTFKKTILSHETHTY